MTSSPSFQQQHQSTQTLMSQTHLVLSPQVSDQQHAYQALLAPCQPMFSAPSQTVQRRAISPGDTYPQSSFDGLEPAVEAGTAAATASDVSPGPVSLESNGLGSDAHPHIHVHANHSPQSSSAISRTTGLLNVTEHCQHLLATAVSQEKAKVLDKQKMPYVTGKTSWQHQVRVSAKYCTASHCDVKYCKNSSKYSCLSDGHSASNNHYYYVVLTPCAIYRSRFAYSSQATGSKKKSTHFLLLDTVLCHSNTR